MICLTCISERKCTVAALASVIDRPDFLTLIRRFLFAQLNRDGLSVPEVAISACPSFHGLISVYHSAIATYYAPSDPSGMGGMRRERIHSRPSWRNGPARRDCIFVNTNPELDGMRGLDIARVMLFFAFSHQDQHYPCALVHWFSRIGNEADEDTGMWRVRPDYGADGKPLLSVLHLDCVLRAAHLIGVYGTAFIPKTLTFDQSLNVFQTYYVNKFIDHHAFQIAF
jgi:hypothetical protein